MNRSPSLKSDVSVEQVARKHSTNDAGEHATLRLSDSAALPLPDLLQILHSTNAGLSASDAAATLKRIGSNRIDTAKRKTLLIAFIERFSNPLVAILLFAAAVSAFTGDVPSFVVIAVIVLMSLVLDVAQEHQAQNAADSLRKQVSLSAKVLRSGQPIDIPAAEIVPGDHAGISAHDHRLIGSGLTNSRKSGSPQRDNTA